MTIQAYHRPETVAEALRLLNQPAGDIAILAGGTTLVAANSATEVVDLQQLPLTHIEVTQTHVIIGAMVRLQTLVSAESIPSFIRQMAQNETFNTFRNAATLGGLVASAEPNSELYATLLAFGATLHYHGTDGVQTMALAAYRPGMLAGRIITAIVIERDGAASYERVARTPADKPIVAVVGRQTGERLVLAACGVAATPILVALDQIDTLTPLADFLGSSSYRRQMASVLGRRVTHQLTN